MLELSSLKKMKIHLADYPFEQDLASRAMLLDFSPIEFEILEALFYSPLKISLKKLKKELEVPEDLLLKTLEKLSVISLLSIEEDLISVDKEMRKYFEFESQRFSEDFKPDIEFLQGLFKKIPIQLLPIWYAIPRTSDHIFHSIVEKYLITPQIYQRYLSEIHFSRPVISQIMEDLFSSKELLLFSSDVISKYNLERKEFDEILLLLEFHLIAFLSFEKEGDHWVEKITPFEEWRQYLFFVRESLPPSLPEREVSFERGSSFLFLEKLTAALLQNQVEGELGEKLISLGLVALEEGRLATSVLGEKFLKMNFEEKALYLYSHPEHRPKKSEFSDLFASEKQLREAEKIVKRSLHGGWTLFEDALRGSLISLSESSTPFLKKTGRSWGYQIPTYTDEEKGFIERVLFETLLEEGVILEGRWKGKKAFSVTPFGRALFEE